MARRTQQASELEAAAYARTAVDQVVRAPDPVAAAQQVLDEAADPRLQIAVLETAAAAPNRATAALVRAALRSGRAELARTAAELLIYVADSPDALDLVALCMDSADATVRRRAVDALESFSEPGAAAFLAPALTDEDGAVRRAATVVFGLVVGTHYHGLRATVLEALSDAASELASAIVANPDEQVRRQAAQSLAFAQSDAVLPTLQLLARDEDDEVRQETVLCLAALGTQKAAELMADMLTDKSYRVSSTVIDMLAAQLGANSSAFLKQLERALEHPLAEVRRQAVLMLDRFDAEVAVPILARAAKDADFEVARRAGEMLRRLHADVGLDWLDREMDRQAAGGRAMSVWEAGNIGMGTGGVAAESRMEQAIPMLERAIREGSASDKLHAIGELTALRDICDARPMRDALYDRDVSVRTRAADALFYTRDAGLLADVLGNHPDPFVRRRAAEALAANPGGPERGGAINVSVSFTGARTVGMELFGCFVRALADADTGVQQQACEAIRAYARGIGLLPVRMTVKALERVADDPAVSILVQEDAGHTLDALAVLPVVDMICAGVDDVLGWRGRVARQAHALRAGPDRYPQTLAGTLSGEELEQWVRDYDLNDEQAEALRRVSAGAGTLERSTAEELMAGIARDLSAAQECIAHAARALRLIAHDGAAESLEQWRKAVEAAPGLDWGDGEAAARHLLRLSRLRHRARIEVGRALACLRGDEGAEAAAGSAGSEDDWVRLCALDAGAPADDALLLCQAHADERDYAEPVGRCAAALLKAGHDGAVDLLLRVLAVARGDARMELTQRTLIAAQAEEGAAALRAGLEGRRLDGTAELCLALALRGAGGRSDALDLPEVKELGDDLEARCARLALGAMANEPDPAAELEELLREGSPQERYAAAWFLSLARVRSAVPIFSSVRDQEAPYLLRALAAASLIRRGHNAGTSWFDKVLGSVQGEQKTRILGHLCAAVEDTVPLMMECKDVNVGRFV